MATRAINAAYLFEVNTVPLKVVGSKPCGTLNGERRQHKL